MSGRGAALAFLAPGLVLAGVSLSGGCGRSGDQREPLRFWALGAEGERVGALVRDFERANPEIRVRVQQLPFSAAHEKLLTAYVGDATPDLAQVGNTWVPEFAALDALLPLDSLVSGSPGLDSADYFPGIWDANVVNGRLYGVPWYVDTRVIFYRKDLLARAGYREIPDTWAGWREAMEAIQRRAGPGQYAIFLPTNEWAQPVVLGLQAGSPILKDGGRYGAFSDSAFRRAFDFYLCLYRDGLAPALGNNDIANAYQEFARGRFAMWITGPWNIGELRRRMPPQLQDDWGTAPLPGPTGDSSGVSLAGGSSLVIFRASPHQAAAWRLAEYLSRPEQQLRFYRLTGDLPARRAAWERSGLKDDRYARAFWAQLQRVRPLPKVPEAELIATRILQAAELSIRGGAPAALALARLDRQVDAILEKRRWLLARRADR